MIYLLRIPTNVVVGTSLFQIIFVTAYTTIVQAATNFSVDIVLAFILMVAGVIGAQYGVRVGQKLRGEQLRALLGLLVLAVGLRLAIALVVALSRRLFGGDGSGQLMRLAVFVIALLCLLLTPLPEPSGCRGRQRRRSVKGWKSARRPAKSPSPRISTARI